MLRGGADPDRDQVLLVIYPGGVHSNASTGWSFYPRSLGSRVQGKRIPRYPSTVDSFTFTVVASAQTGAPFRAPAIFEFF